MEEKISDEVFNHAKEKAALLYRAAHEVYCPYFKDKVFLNRKGWKHILFKRDDKQRSQADQYTRFVLLKWVPDILKTSHNVQGLKETLEWCKQWKHNRWESIPKKVLYFEFIAVRGNVRIKIIIKQHEDGTRYFWSIIPFWRRNRLTNQRKLYGGNLEND